MKKIFYGFYDLFMRPFEKRYIFEWRKDLLTYAKGKVLEVEVGN